MIATIPIIYSYSTAPGQSATAQEFVSQWLHRGMQSLSVSKYWNDLPFYNAYERLSQIEADIGPADSLDADKPNEIAVQNAVALLKILQQYRIAPARLTASAGGGIGIAFLQGLKRALIEVYNEGDLTATLSSGPGGPEVWEFDSRNDALIAAVERIGVYLSSAAA